MGIALAALLGQIGLPGGGFGHGYASMAEVGAPRIPYPFPVLGQGSNPVDTLHPRRADQRAARASRGRARLQRAEAPPARHSARVLGRRQPVPPPSGPEPLCAARSRGPTRSWSTIRSGPPPRVTPTSCCRAPRRSNATTSVASHSDGYLIAMPRALDPMGEARDDYEAFSELAKRLGHWDDFTEGRTAREWVEHIYERIPRARRRPWHRRADRSTTSGRRARSGSRPTPKTTRCSIGSAPTPTRARSGTPSGRIELFSETIDSFGYDDCPGHATWLEPEEWLGGARAERFPLASDRQPAGVAPAQPARRGEAQPGQQGGRTRADPHPSRRRRRTRHRRRRRGARVQRSRRVLRRRRRHLRRAAERRQPVDRRVVRPRRPLACPAHPARTATRTCSPPTEARRASHRVRPASTCSSRSSASTGAPPPVRAHRPPPFVQRGDVLMDR